MSALTFALRTLFKTPFVTAIAIVSLALGIGANAAIFSCFNQRLVEALPVPRPAELVNLSAPGPKPGSQSCGQAGGCYVRTSGDPAQSAPAVAAVVKRLDPNLPVANLKTLTQQVRDTTFIDRMMTTLSSLFAGLA